MQNLNDEVSLAFDYSVEKMREIRDKLIGEMVGGLEGESSLAMIPTYVKHLPNGKEKGFAYALDVGGISQIYCIIFFN
jgi:hexokinase